MGPTPSRSLALRCSSDQAWRLSSSVRDRSHLVSNVAISGLALTAEDVDLITEALAEAREPEGNV